MDRNDVAWLTKVSKRKGVPTMLSGCDLSWGDMFQIDLSGADLSGADLGQCDLSFTNLRGADLRGANLSGANVEGVYLDEDTLGLVSREVIGSREDTLYVWMRLGPRGGNRQYIFKTGCFEGDEKKFRRAIQSDFNYNPEYYQPYADEDLEAIPELKRRLDEQYKK